MQCGKIIYASREAASDSIIGITRDKRSCRSKKKPVRTYFCNECAGWHLTSKKRRLRTLINSTKELFTSTSRRIERLLIVDFTSDKDTMGRLCFLLFSLLIVAGTTLGFSNSQIKETPTCQVDDHIFLISDHSCDLVSIHFDMELPGDLLTNNYGLYPFNQSVDSSGAKAFRGFAKMYRGPPDRWGKKLV